MTTAFGLLTNCPCCGSNNQAKDGFTPAGTQRGRCLDCNERYTSGVSATKITRVGLAKKALKLRNSGMSLRGVAKELGINHQTVSNMTKEQLGEFVYLAKRDGLYKIGMSEQVSSRVDSLSVDIVCLIKTDKPRNLEKKLHRMFSSKREYGEWFSLTTEDVDNIKKISGETAKLRLAEVADVV